MKQKGICEECKKEYEYDYNPKFPRKYCHDCSAQKKADYEGLPKPNIEDGNGLELTPVKMPKGAEVYSEFLQKKDNGFHLSPEQSRSNALASAIEVYKLHQITDGKGNRQNIEDIAKKFEKYIVTGE